MMIVYSIGISACACNACAALCYYELCDLSGSAWLPLPLSPRLGLGVVAFRIKMT